MNATLMAKTAYAAPGVPTRTPRGTEYEIFARITHRLQTARDLGPLGFSALARAIYENRRLWTALAADVADPENKLPAPLRARLFYLAEFTQSHSRQILSGKESVDILIEINTAIMRGLRQEGNNA